MNSAFNPVMVCRDLAKPFNTGHLQVVSNGVTWRVSLIQGRLQYAVNSAQSLETLSYHLLRLGLNVAAQGVNNIPPTILEQIGAQSEHSRSGWLSQTVDLLYSNGSLSSGDLKDLTTALSKDALESLFWVTEASMGWSLSEATNGLHMESFELPHFSSIVDDLEAELWEWQKLHPLITSPYQQPYCQNPDLLMQAVPNGRLSQSMLSMLLQLMQGASLRGLSILLKQEPLRVAQLLKPYLAHRSLLLKAPSAPYDRLPRIPAPQAKAEFSTPTLGMFGTYSTKAAPPPPKKIVCIDDSPAMLETIQRYLGSEPFEVATVENPMDSLSTLFEMKPDLILMDVSMPGINGNRLCTILRRSEIFKEIPIIMVSGNTGALDKIQAQSAGATDYLTKPFSREALLDIVNRYLLRTTAAAA
jgi:two-component system, chemotaxis family, response regulator PixG